ncbi:MAG: hypothetical protein U0V70_03115 [Terriglobia bacterium]
MPVDRSVDDPNLTELRLVLLMKNGTANEFLSKLIPKFGTQDMTTFADKYKPADAPLTRALRRAFTVK